MTLPNGYEMESTFWADFSIADKFGISAILDTYDSAFMWKDNIKYMTELAIVLNHKIFQHFESKKDLAEVYDTLWRNVDEYILDGDNSFTEEDKQYYLRITD